MSHPKISIITPTFNRRDELQHLIPSLHNQTIDHQWFELIISDDGSHDGTEELIVAWQRKVDFPILYLTQENQGPGAARNHGLENARGELLLFIDSDCEAHPQWLEKIWDVYVGKKFDACGGPDGAKSDFTPLQKAIDYALTSYLTTGGMRGHSGKMLAKFYPRSHNMGMTRKLYERVGGFGTLRHGQDIELSYRIRKSKARVRFIPEAIVYHRRRTSLRRFFKQVFNWGVARINLGRISPEMLEPVHFLPAAATVVAAGILIGTVLRPEFFAPLLLLGLIVLGFMGLHAALTTKSISVGLLTLVVIPVQVFGYGSGFIAAYLRGFLVGKGDWTGFTKQYYR